MAISFPSSPTLNQTYSYGGKTWTWSGSVWNLNTMVAMDMSDTAPASPSIGALWMNTLTGDLLVYHSSGWMQSGGDVGGVGPTGPTGPSGTNGTNGVDVTTPKITGIVICDSNYSFIDDTAVSTAGGYILVNGTNFTSGSTAVINNTPATSVSFINSTQLRVQVPATPAGTYILYVVGLDGSVAIRVNAVTSSAVPIWTTGSTLPNAVKNGSINIQLATDVGLTYALSGASTLPPGLTLNSGGLLSGTVTGLSVETTYSFIVIATDLELQDTPRTFSITITVGDPYFNLTTLLLQGDTAPTYISDASSNTFEINPVGSVKSDTIQPFQEGYYSGYFNGTTDYLNYTAAALGTATFTVEAWVYLNSNANYAGIFSTLPSNTGVGMALNIQNTGVLNGYLNNGGAGGVIISSPTALATNVWIHVAFVRVTTGSTATLALYVNGISVATSAASSANAVNVTETSAIIGRYYNNLANYYTNGYISNLRVVSGVAVYTGAFTPPTAPLTITQSTVTLAAPTEVEYLVVAGGGGGGPSNYGGGGAGGYRTGTSFAVASGTALTVTVGTGGAIGAKGLDSVFSSITSTGGGFGGGTGQYTPGSGGSGGGALQIPNQSTALGLGNTPSTSPVQGYNGGAGASDLSTYTNGGGGGGAGGVGLNANSTISSGNGGPGVLSSISGISTYYGGGGGGTGQSGTQGTGGIGGGGGSGTAGTINTGGGGGGGAAGGSGIVIIRHADTLAIATCTGSPTITVSNGYKIYKFTSSGTITFNTETKAAITGTDTSLLTLQSNRFKDQTAANLAITTAGTPAIKTLQPFTLPTTWATYGAGFFNGSTDYLSIADNAALEFGTSSITLECWFYMTGTSGYLFDKNNSGTGPAPGFSLFVSTTAITWYYDSVNNGYVIPSITTTIKQNQWHHIALVRSVSGTTTNAVFLNGARVGTSATATAFPDNAQNFRIGTTFLSSSMYGAFTGFISNVRLVKGTAVYDPSLTTLTVPTAPLTAIANTSLLTLQYKQDSNNNGFIDSSQNNFPITRVGTPTQGTSSPFSQTGWSGYFNGTTGYVGASVGTAVVQFALGSVFTFECWIYPIINQAQDLLRIGALEIGYQSATAWGVAEASVAWRLTTTTLPTLNVWNHIAIVRTGTSTNQTQLYLNGSSVATGTYDPALSSNQDAYIGAYSGGTYPFTGSISNLRIVKGVAVYTANFTPPTSPLTITQSAGTNISAITGTQTSLLTLQSNYFRDQAAAALAITVTGTPSIQSFSPFAPTAAYDAATNGGTAYFNGTTDGLSAPAGAAFNFTGDYTIELWVNWTSLAAETAIISNYISSVASDWLLVRPTGGIPAGGIQWYPSSGATYIQTGFVPTVGIWYHIAAVRSGTTCSLYINGVARGGTLTFAGTLGDATKAVYIGVRGGNTTYFPGYLSNVRIVKGTAVYTGTFTPPTAPLTASGATSAASYPSTTNVNTAFPASNTSLLLNGTNGGIIDATSKNLIKIVGDARVSTTQKKYGTGSMYFDGTGDYLTVPATTQFAFGTGSFTIEAWVYLNAYGSSAVGPQIFGTANGSTTNYSINVGESIDRFRVISNAAGSWADNLVVAAGGGIPLNTWTHMCVVRSGANLTIYKNGVSVATTAAAVAWNFTGTTGVIARFNDGITLRDFNGYIDDLRITKYARYTANFTPPSQSFLPT